MMKQGTSMQESCCQGQHMYLHAQMMLMQLARLPRGARFRRLSQELELHAAKLKGQIAWQMHFWWAAPASYSAGCSTGLH